MTEIDDIISKARAVKRTVKRVSKPLTAKQKQQRKAAAAASARKRKRAAKPKQQSPKLKKAPDRPFPITKKWRRVPKEYPDSDPKTVTDDGYEIRTTSSMFRRSDRNYVVSRRTGKQPERIGTYPSMEEAKVAVEMHSQGYEPDVYASHFEDG